MNKLILHIPHSSAKIPLNDGYLASEEDLKSEILKLTDWYTEDLFSCDGCEKIIAPFSRIFCDVERFEKDKDEPMSKHGRGLAYTKMDDGAPLREVTPKLRKKIIDDYYKPHHQRLTDTVSRKIEKFGSCIIIDCHSFPDKPFKIEKDNRKRPSICIGVDEYHTPKDLLGKVEQYLDEKKIDYEVNYPYSGSIVPMKYYKKDKRVRSIMIEVSRDLYLTSGTNEKNDNYDQTKKITEKTVSLLVKRSD